MAKNYKKVASLYYDEKDYINAIKYYLLELQASKNCHDNVKASIYFNLFCCYSNINDQNKDIFSQEECYKFISLATSLNNKNIKYELYYCYWVYTNSINADIIDRLNNFKSNDIKSNDIKLKKFNKLNQDKKDMYYKIINKI